LNLDSDPPVEISACVRRNVNGFSIKLESGNVRVFGYVNNAYSTDWALFGGPIVGMYHADLSFDYAIIIGD